MIVYRLTPGRFKNTLSGKGASVYGARWNSIGTELIYTACNRSLAMAEVLVHLEMDEIPGDYFMMDVFVPDFPSGEVLPEDLDFMWSHPLNYNRAAQKIGDSFIRSNELLSLKVPSAVTKGEFNYLINPFHRDFKKVEIVGCEKFPFDMRLVSR